MSTHSLTGPKTIDFGIGIFVKMLQLDDILTRNNVKKLHRLWHLQLLATKFQLFVRGSAFFFLFAQG